MKHWLIFLLSLLMTAAAMDGARAQSLPWVRAGGGTNPDFGVANAYDAQGNLYVAGYYNSPQFSLGGSSITRTGNAPNLFVAKYGPDGTLAWLRGAHADNSSGTGIQTSSIAVDGAGNVYIAGIFDGTGRFGAQSIQAADVADAFVAKITTAGNFEWAFRAGSNGFGDGAASVSWANGALYVTGYFAGTLQYGSQQFQATPGSSDVFVARHDANGGIAWVRSFGAQGPDQGTAVAAGQGGDLYVAGYFSNGTLSLAGVEGNNINIINQGNRDGFVARLRASDGLAYWVSGFGGVNPDQATAVSVQGTSIYVGGIVQGTGNFVSAAGIPTSFATGANTEDGFIARYDVNGGLSWVQLIGGTDVDRVRGLAGDGAGGVFATGSFRGTIEAASSIGANSATSNGVDDIFVARYNSLGYVSGSLRAYGGANADNGRGLASFSGRLALIGSFRSSQIAVEGVTLTNNSPSGSSEDVLIAVREINLAVCTINQITPTVQQGPVEIVQCAPRTTLTVNAQGASDFVVRWFRNGVQIDAAGTTITVDQSGSYQARLVSASVGNCQSNLSTAVNVNLPPAGLTAAISPATSTIEAGQSVTLTANASAAPGVTVSYMWSTGETSQSITVSPSATTSYTVNVMGTDGCAASAVATVTVFTPGENSVSITAQGPACTGVTLTATTQPAGLPVVWQLNGTEIGSGNSIVASQAGNYTATAGGATSNSIGVIASPTINAGQDQFIDQFSSATLTATFTGGAADNILWSNASTGGFVGVGQSITVSPSNTTTYIATLNNGICAPVSDAVTVFVNQLNEPFVFTQNGNVVLDSRVIVSSLETVNISFIAVSITPSGTYTWTNAAGQTVSNSPTFTYTAGFYQYGGNNVTTFNLTVAGIDGQSYTRTVSVIIRPDIEDPAGASICLGGCAPARTVTGRAGLNLAPYNFSYQWLPAEGANVSNGGRTIVACPTTSTSYSIIVTDNATGATTTETFRVNVIDESYNPLVSSDGTVICPGGTVTLTVTDAGTSYRWFYNGTIIPNASASSITVNQEGTYSVQVVGEGASGLNCASGASNSITLVKRDFLPVPPLTPYGNISVASCTQEMVTLATDDFGPGVAYRWIKDGVLIAGATERTYTVTPESGSGFYQVEIYVPECSNIPPKRSSVSTHVTFLPVPAPEIFDAAFSGCENVVVEVTGVPTAPFGQTWVYSWSPAVNISSVSIPNPLVTINGNTTYTLTVTNEYGCSDQAVFTFTQTPPTPNAQVAVSGATFQSGAFAAECANQTLLLSSTIDGAVNANYGYQWVLMQIDQLGIDFNAIWNEYLNSPNFPQNLNSVEDIVNFFEDVLDIEIDFVAVPGQIYPLWELNFLTLPEQLAAQQQNISIPIGQLLPNMLLDEISIQFETANYTAFALTFQPGCKPGLSNFVNITRMPFPKANAGPDQYICQGAPSGLLGTLLSAELTNSFVYEWQPTTGLLTPNLPLTHANPSQTTTYTLTVRHLTTGCYSTDEVTVHVTQQPGIPSIQGLGTDLLPLPVVDEMGATFCYGHSALLRTPEVPGYQYQWYVSYGIGQNQILQPLPGQTNPSLIISPEYAGQWLQVPTPMGTPSGIKTAWFTVSTTVPGCITTYSLPYHITQLNAPVVRARADEEYYCFTSDTRVNLTGLLEGGNLLQGFYPNTLVWRWEPTTYAFTDANGNVVSNTGTFANATLNTLSSLYVRPAQTTTFTFTATDAVTGCTSTSTVTVNVAQKPQIINLTHTGSLNLCQGDVVLQASASLPQAEITWSVWDDAGGWMEIPGAVGPTYSPNIGGRYRPTAWNAWCYDVADDYISVVGVDNGAEDNTLIRIQNANGGWDPFVTPAYICEWGQTVTLRARYIFGVSYEWYRRTPTGDVQVYSWNWNDPSNVLTTGEPGEYYVKLIAGHTCSAISKGCPVLLIPGILPSVYPSNSYICEGQSSHLFTESMPGFGYQWQFRASEQDPWQDIAGANGPEFGATQPGFYRVRTSSLYSECEGYSAAATVRAATAVVSGAGQVCEGGEISASFAIYPNAGSYGSQMFAYQWQIWDAALGAWRNLPYDYASGWAASGWSVSFRPQVSGTYRAVFTHDHLCVAPAVANVEIVDNPFNFLLVVGEDICTGNYNGVQGHTSYGNAAVNIAGPQLGVEYRLVTYGGDVLNVVGGNFSSVNDGWYRCDGLFDECRLSMRLRVSADQLTPGLNAVIVEARRIGATCEPIRLFNRALINNFNVALWTNGGQPTYAPLQVSVGTQVWSTTEWFNPALSDDHRWQRWNGTAWEDIAGVAASYSSYTFNEEGIYRVRVDINNLDGFLGGCTSYSNPVFVGVAPQTCAAPTGLSATYDAFADAIFASWNAVLGASSYEVEAPGVENIITNIPNVNVPSPGPGIYTIRVRSICETGTSAWVSTTVVVSDAACPTPVVNFVDVDFENEEVRVSWTPVPGAQGYRLTGSLVDAVNGGPLLTGDADIIIIYASIPQGVDYDLQVTTVCAEGLESAPSEVQIIALRRYRSSLVTDVKVYPNPTRGAFEIEFASAESGTATLELTDATGRTVYRTTFEAVKGNNQYSVNVTDSVSSGLYLLRLVQGGTQHTTRLMVD